MFNANDVEKVATAIGSGLYIDESGKNAYEICEHCRARRYHDWNEENTDKFPHALDCVVLIAQDLLIGKL